MMRRKLKKLSSLLTMPRTILVRYPEQMAPVVRRTNSAERVQQCCVQFVESKLPWAVNICVWIIEAHVVRIEFDKHDTSIPYRISICLRSVSEPPACLDFGVDYGKWWVPSGQPIHLGRARDR